MIRLLALGSLDLRGSDGEELRSVLAQPRRAALLVYLALATPSRPQRRDSLLALFWPEQDTEHARNALNQAVYFIRGQLEADTLVSNGDSLHLEWKNLWCDATEFEEALDRGRAAEAIDLYQGDLLEGFHIADAPGFTEWLEVERGRLADRYSKALETVAEKREVAQDYGGAAEEWRKLAARDPYSSRVALRLMRALAAAGDPGGAVQHARIHETLLREELAIAPDPEIAAFLRQLQSTPATPVEGQVREFELSAPNAMPTPYLTTESKAVPAHSHGATAPQSRRPKTALLASVAALLAVAGAFGLGSEGGSTAKPLIRSLAVLPLENLSGDSSEQSFTDGLHDVLITELARYPELSVISRTSVLQYKGTKKPLSEIARELEVDGLIEGALLREGGRVRITAQLIHGPSDRHLWAERYERDLRDVLVLQSEVAQAIARAVQVAAAPPGPVRRSPAGPVDSAPEELHLRELYLRGRHAELSRSLVGVETAREAYRRAIELDSTFALGYAGLAAVYGYMADYDYAPVGSALDTARMMARRAVALDSTLPEARTALAVTLSDGGEFQAAEREFQRAIELGPSNPRAHYWYSILLVALGRGEDALREARRSAALDPFAPRGLLAMERYAGYLITGQRPQQKTLPVKERRPILKLEPGEPWARARTAVELAEAGECTEAQTEILSAHRLVQATNLIMRKFSSLVHWACGERARARSILAEIKRHPEVRDHGFEAAWLHARFGETDSAFAWLEHHRWTLADLSSLSAGRWMDPLRSDPRFPQLLRRLGLRHS